MTAWHKAGKPHSMINICFSATLAPPIWLMSHLACVVASGNTVDFSHYTCHYKLLLHLAQVVDDDGDTMKLR